MSLSSSSLSALLIPSPMDRRLASLSRPPTCLPRPPPPSPRFTGTEAKPVLCGRRDPAEVNLNGRHTPTRTTFPCPGHRFFQGFQTVLLFFLL